MSRPTLFLGGCGVDGRLNKAYAKCQIAKCHFRVESQCGEFVRLVITQCYIVNFQFSYHFLSDDSSIDNKLLQLITVIAVVVPLLHPPPTNKSDTSEKLHCHISWHCLIRIGFFPCRHQRLIPGASPTGIKSKSILDLVLENLNIITSSH